MNRRGFQLGDTVELLRSMRDFPPEVRYTLAVPAGAHGEVVGLIGSSKYGDLVTVRFDVGTVVVRLEDLRASGAI